MKNKIGIISACSLILILSLVLVLSKDSYAVTEVSGTISLNCNASTLTAEGQTTCTLNGTMTNSEVTAISARLNLSSNLSLVSITTQSGWEGNGNDGIIELYKDGTNGTSFGIVSFVIKASNVSSSQTGTISINSIKYKDSDYSSVIVNDVNQSMTIIPKPTPTPVKSSNNYLKSLSLSNGSISFNKNTTTYNTSVGSNVSSVNITAAKEDSKSSFVSGYGPRTVKLQTGLNSYQIQVQAENGAIKIYTINITRAKASTPSSSSSSTNKSSSASASKSTSQTSTTKQEKSSDNKIKSLNLSKGSIDFKSDTTEYNIEVPYTVTSLDIEGTLSDSKATVKGFGTKTISVGKNKFEIIVTAENGDKKTYTINVERREDTGEQLDSNNDLEALSVVGHEIDFDKDTLNYEIEIKNEKELNISAKAESEKAEISIVGNENLKDKDEVKIIVTAEDGNNKIYTITVNEKKSSSLLMISIAIFVIGLLAMIGVLKYKKNQDSNN